MVKCHILSIPFFTGSSVSIAESSFSLKAIQGKTGSVNDLGPGCPPDSCLSFLPVRPHSESLQADARLHHSMATGSGHDFGPGCPLILHVSLTAAEPLKSPLQPASLMLSSLVQGSGFPGAVLHRALSHSCELTSLLLAYFVCPRPMASRRGNTIPHWRTWEETSRYLRMRQEHLHTVT